MGRATPVILMAMSLLPGKLVAELCLGSRLHCGMLARSCSEALRPSRGYRGVCVCVLLRKGSLRDFFSFNLLLGRVPGSFGGP